MPESHSLWPSCLQALLDELMRSRGRHSFVRSGGRGRGRMGRDTDAGASGRWQLLGWMYVRGAYTQVEGQDEQIMMLEQQLLAVHEESAREASDLRAEVYR